MGYTHYWRSERSFTDEEWEQLAIRARQILNYSQDTRGDALAFDFDVNAAPLVTPDQIRFNGFEDEGYETFCLTKISPRDFCKTARKPYDASVVAILMEADRICDGFSWSSDGEGEEDYLTEAQSILDNLDPLEEEVA